MDNLRILIVEDSPIVAERLRESLREMRAIRIIDTIDRENKAIEAIERGGVDVVVLDLRLNRGTGFGVLRALSNHEERPIVIIFTNYDLPEYRRQALALGADYFLDKARDFERLPQLIETLRGGRPRHPELVPA
ncbi:MAG TPA: response regulator [Steroidobacteraceae bacterium]|nr:response regulator [Steroidobacteraceae bacterium]